MRIRTVFALFLFPVLSLPLGHRAAAQGTAAPAAPQADGHFGDPGQWVFSTDAALTIQRRTQSGVSGAVTTITIAPAADYFLVHNLSLGGFIAITYTKTGGEHASRFELGPRLGYNIAFAELWSVWPRIGFSYAHTGISGGAKGNAVALNLYAPILFHPVAHFFVGFGPFVDTDLNGDHRATVWGAKLTLGGWL